MNVQTRNTGIWSVRPVKVDGYYSPLKVRDNYPSIVTYSDTKSGEPIGKVYREDSQWYLATCYREWVPFPVSAKYEGFLILSELHKIQKQGYST